MTTEGSDARLPDELADEAGLQLLAATGERRLDVLRALVAAHPQHTAALHRLCRDLGCVDGMLADAYHAPGPSDADDPPPRIGGYRVIRRLGDGAFGIVYLCAQDEPVARHVAIKVLRPDTGGRQTLPRFAAERQLLAALNHPAITQVFDAGELPDGRPFFVMEYVDGEPLRHYCDTHALGVRERLRLFVDVCRGVAHAHARGIVHRDLKPANVLVVDTEAGPAPKIIDFGIAKALVVPAESAARAATEAGRVVGTPGYMSPEQAGGRVGEIDARTDVFALGVMMYELLTGHLPWPRGASATTADPIRPSRRVTADTGIDGRAAAGRQRLAAELRGDLDWISAKALARLREERYPTATALAADLERHLRGEAVSVGPPSLVYRTRKFVRRNRVAVAAVTVAAGLAGAAWFAYFTLAARTANREAQATLAVETLLARAGDERLRRLPQNDGVRRSLAQDALAFYDLWLRDRPADRRLRTGRCRALVSLSQVHWQLGQAPDAERTASEAIAEARALHGDVPDDLEVQSLLADALRRNGRALVTVKREAEAIPLLTESIEHLEACNRRAPRSHALSLSSALRELASAHRSVGQGKRCLDAERRSVAVLDESVDLDGIPPMHHTDAAIARSVLAGDLVAAGLLDEATLVLAAADEGLAMVRTDRDHAVVAVEDASSELARRRGDLAGAIDHKDRAVAAAERWHVAEPGRFQPAAALVADLQGLGDLLDKAGRWPEADATLQRAIDVAEAMVKVFADDIERLASLERLLLEAAHQLYDRLRRPDLELAERWARRAIDVHDELRRLAWQRPVPRSQVLVLLAMIVESRGGDSDALWDTVATELTVDADIGARDHELDFAGWLGLATSRLRRGRIDETEFPLARAARWIVDPRRNATMATELEWVKARVAIARGDVAALTAAATRTLALRDTWMGRWRAADCRLAAAEIVAAAGGDAREHRVAAEKLYRQVVDELAPRVVKQPDDPWFGVPCGFAGLRLARIEADRGNNDEARRLLEAALRGLDTVADIAHRDLWQPDVIAAARTLQTQLGPGGAR